MLTLSDNSRVGPTGCLTIRANSTLTVDKGLEIEGELDWPGGTIAGSGTTVIAPSATASLDSFVNKTLDGTLRNEGLAVWTAGPISINGTFENAGLFDIQSNWSIGSPLSSGVFHNLGTLARTTNSGQPTSVTVDLVNEGVVDVQAGRLSLGGLFFNLPGGLIMGDGEIGLLFIEEFVNEGISLGGGIGEPGILTYDGIFEMSGPTATLSVYLAGEEPGSEYSQVEATQDGSIGGVVAVELAPNYVPAIGDPFKVLSCSFCAFTDAGLTIDPPTGVEMSVTFFGDVLVEATDVFSAQATGTCPSSVDLTFRGATPKGIVVVASSSAPGEFKVPGGSCEGLSLDLESPAVLGQLTVDTNGDVVLGPLVLSEMACGLYFQAVDLATCKASTVGRISEEQ